MSTMNEALVKRLREREKQLRECDSDIASCTHGIENCESEIARWQKKEEQYRKKMEQHKAFRETLTSEIELLRTQLESQFSDDEVKGIVLDSIRGVLTDSTIEELDTHIESLKGYGLNFDSILKTAPTGADGVFGSAKAEAKKAAASVEPAKHAEPVKSKRGRKPKGEASKAKSEPDDKDKVTTIRQALGKCGFVCDNVLQLPLKDHERAGAFFREAASLIDKTKFVLKFGADAYDIYDAVVNAKDLLTGMPLKSKKDRVHILYAQAFASYLKNRGKDTSAKSVLDMFIGVGYTVIKGMIYPDNPSVCKIVYYRLEDKNGQVLMETANIPIRSSEYVLYTDAEGNRIIGASIGCVTYDTVTSHAFSCFTGGRDANFLHLVCRGMSFEKMFEDAYLEIEEVIA